MNEDNSEQLSKDKENIGTKDKPFTKYDFVKSVYASFDRTTPEARYRDCMQDNTYDNVFIDKSSALDKVWEDETAYVEDDSKNTSFKAVLYGVREARNQAELEEMLDICAKNKIDPMGIRYRYALAQRIEDMDPNTVEA